MAGELDDRTALPSKVVEEIQDAFMRRYLGTKRRERFEKDRRKQTMPLDDLRAVYAQKRKDGSL